MQHAAPRAHRGVKRSSSRLARRKVRQWQAAKARAIAQMARRGEAIVISASASRANRNALA